MRLKLDENLGRRWVDQLRAAGHDADTVVDEQLSGAPDHQVLAAAVAEHRGLVTMDLDFANPIRFPPAETAGIAVLRLREHTTAEDIDRLVAQLVTALDTSDLAGHLWIVEQHRVRQYTEPTDW